MPNSKTFTPRDLGKYGLQQMYYNSEELAPPWRKVAELRDPNLGWEWSVFLIFTDGSRYYWYEGSGCSCNSPMDDATSVDDLPQGTARDVLTDLKAWAVNGYGGEGEAYLHATESVWFKELQAEAEQ